MSHSLLSIFYFSILLSLSPFLSILREYEDMLLGPFSISLHIYSSLRTLFSVSILPPLSLKLSSTVVCVCVCMCVCPEENVNKSGHIVMLIDWLIAETGEGEKRGREWRKWRKTCIQKKWSILLLCTRGKCFQLFPANKRFFALRKNAY